jgi:hypothetical protein
MCAPGSGTTGGSGNHNSVKERIYFPVLAAALKKIEWELAMPCICDFDGIMIYMYYNDHIRR